MSAYVDNADLARWSAASFSLAADQGGDDAVDKFASTSAATL
jgi:hypothetical protein